MRARDNPFSTDRVLTVRYRFYDGTTWETLLARLAEMNWRGAVVGPDGSGKTTLLEDLQPRLRERGFAVRSLRLTATDNRFPRGFLARALAGIGRDDIILFDGADHMPRLAWTRFARRTRPAGGLVITSHRAGRLPTLIECSSTPRALDDILAALVGDDAARLRNVGRRLYEKHRGNLRDVLRALYDLYAARMP